MYQRQAQGLASLGRGPDTELVHMTPREVKSFDRLARVMGHDGLPTNPQTGLPEAGIFDSLLPVIGGLGLTVLSGGVINPLTAGLITGVGTGLATGSAKKGLLAGLGGLGGASLGAGLASAGAGGAAGGAAGSGSMMGGLTPGAGNIGANVANVGKGLGAVVQNPAAFGTTMGPFGSQVTTKGLMAGGGKGLALAGGAALAPAMMQPPPEFKPVEFEKKDYSYPEGGFMPPPRTSIDPFAGDPVAAGFTEERSYFTPDPFTSPGYMPARAGGLVSLHEGGGIAEELESAISGSAFDQVDADKKAGIFGGNQGLLPTTPSSGMLPTTPDNKEAIRKGGLKNVLERLLRSRRNGGEGPQFLGGTNQFYDQTGDKPEIDINEFLRWPNQYYAEAMQNRNESGPIQTQSKNQGGLLRGPGDGMSDDIMLPITGSRDIAAVSPDEFVVPADVVSGLGNGSTSAGAKQLYGMMDRVRDTRTGKTEQPRAINAGKMMPV